MAGIRMIGEVGLCKNKWVNMSISIHDNELQLGNSGEYLLKTRIVPEQRAPFLWSYPTAFSV